MKKQQKTQKGSASIYSVVILMLFASITVVGFVRLMSPLIRQASNYNLSQSAYDAAMTGVEDAKYALSNYRKCKEGDNAFCINNIKNEFASPSCKMLPNILGISSDENGEVKIGSDAISDITIDESYSCVKIYPDAGDYAGTLDSVNPSRLIAVSAAGAKKISIEWSEKNEREELDALNIDRFSNEKNGAAALHLDYITAGDIKMKTFIPSSDDPQINNGDNYNYESVRLKDGKYSVTYAINPSSASDDLIRLSLFAYDGDTSVDFTLKLLGDGDEQIPMFGVQARIDSTGRAGDMVRRIEARVDYSNQDYPFLNYALASTYAGIDKNYYVTKEGSSEDPSYECNEPTLDFIKDSQGKIVDTRVDYTKATCHYLMQQK